MKTKRSEDDLGGRAIQLGDDKSKRPALGTITNVARPVADAKAALSRSCPGGPPGLVASAMYAPAPALSAAAAAAAAAALAAGSSSSSMAPIAVVDPGEATSAEDEARFQAISEASGVSALPSAVSASARQSEAFAHSAAATMMAPSQGELDAAVAHITDYVDVDSLDREDPTKVVDYVEDIYSYLRQLERRFRPRVGYMARQRDINHSMRAILVDWLVEVAEEYRLNLQTLYTSVGYIDRFLSEMSVQRGKLQLVGVTCMLLAAKYEEIYPPAVDEFVYITDHTYTKDQILKMEHLVLKVLRFDMGAVTVLTFLERFVKVAMANERTQHLALYLCELTLQDADRYLKYRPSVLAASAVIVSLYILGLPHWTPTLRYYTQLSDEDVRECTSDLHFTFNNASRDPQQAVFEKYSNAKFSSVSRIAGPGTPPVIASSS